MIASLYSIFPAPLTVLLLCQLSLAETPKQLPRKKNPFPTTQTPFRAFDLPVTQWVGKKFMVLEKQGLVRQFGYELYLTAALGASKKKPDPAWETPQRRVRCDKIGKSYIIVNEALPAGREYLVKFTHEQTGVVLFGKTRDGSIEGVAFAADIDAAQKRWHGKVVYSVRRFIDVFDSVTGKLDNIKVRIDQPLTVVDVRWGLTPLPPKPLWIMVTSECGEKGFIPTRTSWTNAITVIKSDSTPWSDDLMEIDPKKVYTWDEAVWEAVNNHSVATGMTRQQVRMSWGGPKSVTQGPSGNAETWAYAAQNLLFTNDSLVSTDSK